MNRQRLALAVLVGILILALAYAFWATPRQQRVAAPGGAPSARTRPAPTPRVEAPGDEGRVRLDLLARDEQEFPGFKRDIFRYPPVARPPAPKPPPPAPEPVPEPEPEPEPVLEPEPVVPVEVQRELARFTFLGFLQKGGVKTIFLSSGGELFVVKQGDRFGKERAFHVIGLSAELLTIRQGDDPRSINIPLVEQAPLAPAAPAPPAGHDVPFPH